MVNLAPIRSLYPFKSRYAVISGPKQGQAYKLHYIDEGLGEPVVMLHGNPTWSFYYHHLIQDLKDFCRCLVPDHIGCGLSDKPQHYPYHLQTHIDNIIQWLKQLKIGRFHLIVHDWGGAIGMGVALRMLARVRTLTILNSAAFLCEHIPVCISICRLPIIGPMLIKYGNVFVRAALNMTTTYRLDGPTKRAYKFPYRRVKDRVAINAFVQDIPMSQDHPSYRTLADIEKNLSLLADKPCLLAWGMQDFCFTPLFLDRWKEYLPLATVHPFPEAGHYILEDAREEVNALIRSHISKNQCVEIA